MAVYAAHLTRTLQGNPSVFQVAAQDALGETVKPALRKLVEYVAAVYPNKCGWCETWYDELFLLLDYCLQYHYLKHYAASFSECFYGLVRVPISPSTEFSSGTRLPQNLERGSLALLVLLPYVRQKVEKMVDKWREDIEDGRLGKSKTDRARKAAVRLWSVVHFLGEAGRLALLARYLTGAGRAPTPALRLLGLTLRDAPAERPDDTWGDFVRAVAAGRLGCRICNVRACRQERGGHVPDGVARVQRRRAARGLRRAAAALVGRAPPAGAAPPARAAAAAARGRADAQRVPRVPPALARAHRAAGLRFGVLLHVRCARGAGGGGVPRDARTRRARHAAAPVPRPVAAGRRCGACTSTRSRRPPLRRLYLDLNLLPDRCEKVVVRRHKITP
ncbi:peroxisome assembly protein 12 isoform X4 [Nymphalis io]|uniref:peroxisome assembly protein 12 isoform X4 n=1 Tax=Inachis io TaxID=171585 RepID=UPI00216A2156|nr:peroxisome assembly protein 12 isoform X4 [Nymphalis io]